MKSKASFTKSGTLGIVLLLACGATTLYAQTPEEFQQLKKVVEKMQKTIDAQNARIDALEKEKAEKAAAPPTVAAPPVVVIATNRVEAASVSMQTLEKIASGEHV